MNVELRFDSNGNVLLPKLILLNRNLTPIGELTNITNVNLTDSLEDSPQITFDIYKSNNGKFTPFWNELVSFKIVGTYDFDEAFEAIVEEEESDNGTVKHVTLTQLSCAELSQIHVYGLNINTEDSIIYDDEYKPTVLYDADDPDRAVYGGLRAVKPDQCRKG